MNILFLSCLKATALIEKKLHFKLSFKESIQLKMHKIMCRACTHYEKQSTTLEKGIAQSLQNTPASEIDTTQLKVSIHEKLSK